MAKPRRKRNAPRVLVIALLFLALAVALFVLIPRAIGSATVTQIPTPGQITLPPTAPVATAVATATSK